MHKASDSGREGQSLEMEAMLRDVSMPVARVLGRALEGSDLTVEESVLLFQATGAELTATVRTADELRRQTVGDRVTYVVNRNINFTNVCIKQCGFCAFSRDFRQEEGYFLPTEEIVRRAKEAWELGATEVCIQAGLPPQMEGDLYIRLTRAIKEALPEIHIHGFSPEEVLYGAVRSRISIRDYLRELQQAGVGSLPGTSAEILDQEVRDRISPGRIGVAEWVKVITTAHELGIPTTSTIMFGHLESDLHKARHLALLRDIQKRSGGFTELVPLSFVHTEAPMYARRPVPGVRPGATREEVIRMHAVSRIVLNQWIPNLQVSWVKEGLAMSRLLLSAGVNDMGGTLMNESISTAAGAPFGQLVSPATFRKLIRETGRVPAERHTDYRIRRIFDGEDGEAMPDPLDALAEGSEERLGSYHKLIKMSDYRYQHPRRKSKTTAAGDEPA
ncbi:MAG TPA: 5-amino-6-(D-ribitylamino)uracil--L-tyrosine 4-hydroxyphenyl transferase CofH [Vicinamibacteria bacterium]|nr:5-amino-6-(D-ribitylamino)uracil--L-tyrosine 4-hydroxyphenyl transferase CofH [Vicinamibacteria bacterium]